MYRKLIIVLALIALLAAFQPVQLVDASSPAQSGSGVVGNGTAASCTETALRNTVASFKNITFNCGPNPVTIQITREIAINTPKIINGGKKITLDAGGRTRVFRVAPYQQAAFYNMTIKNGRITPRSGDTDRTGWGQGAAIFADTGSDITVNTVIFSNNVSTANVNCRGGGAIFLGGFNYAEVLNSAFFGNKAMNGGAINNVAADLVVRNTVFDGNEANYNHAIVPTGLHCVGGGGAIIIDGASPIEYGGKQTINISYSTFKNNKSGTSGGGVFAYLYKTGTVTIDHAKFENNRSIMVKNANGTWPGDQGNGGGLYMGGEEAGVNYFTGKFVVSNSTFNNNHADFNGGGISLHAATLYMSNTTIANNEARNGYAFASTSTYRGLGGGLAMFEGTKVVIKTRLSNVTISGNTAGLTGGGIFGSHGATVTTPLVAKLENSVIANNVANGKKQNCNRSLVNLWGNVQWPGIVSGSWGVTCSAGAVTVDPKLGTLGYYGGYTQTVPLLAGSGAINRANSSYCPRYDQRGYTRVGACDSGAFEYGGKPPVP